MRNSYFAQKCRSIVGWSSRCGTHCRAAATSKRELNLLLLSDWGSQTENLKGNSLKSWRKLRKSSGRRFFATLKRTFWRCLNFLYLKSTCLMGIRFVLHLSCPISERNAPVSVLRHGPNSEVIVHIPSWPLVFREMKKILRFLNFLSEHIFCYWRCCARIFQGIDHLENMLMFSYRVCSLARDLTA